MRLFQAGDIVRVLRKAEEEERGWGNSWASEMDKAVGKQGRVISDQTTTSLYDVNVKVEGVEVYGYPSFALKLLPKGLSTAKQKGPCKKCLEFHKKKHKL